ncbi:MAG: N-glycosylase/DNA lyase [bacterium]
MGIKKESLQKTDVRSIDDLKAAYRRIKPDIVRRLKEFRGIYESRDFEKIQHEMMFCILTPQSKAKVCWSCIEELIDSEDVGSISKNKLREYIKPVRFYNNKTEHMYQLLENIRSGAIDIDELVYSSMDIVERRDLIVKTVKGYGYKEASHFLRNIGLGEDIAILDRHILRNLTRHGIINKTPKAISRKKYLEMEKRMSALSGDIHIPIAHLDILFWYNETGGIFK